MEEELQSGLSAEEPTQGYQQWQFNQYEPPKQVSYRTNYVKCIVWGIAYKIIVGFLSSTLILATAQGLYTQHISTKYGRDGYPDIVGYTDYWEYCRPFTFSHMQVSMPDCYQYHEYCGGWHEETGDWIRVYTSYESASATEYQTKADFDEYLDKTYKGYAKSETGKATQIDGYTACVYDFEDKEKRYSNGIGEVTVLYNSDTSEIYSFAVVSYVHDDRLQEIFEDFRESIKSVDFGGNAGGSADWGYKDWVSA